MQDSHRTPTWRRHSTCRSELRRPNFDTFWAPRQGPAKFGQQVPKRIARFWKTDAISEDIVEFNLLKRVVQDALSGAHFDAQKLSSIREIQPGVDSRRGRRSCQHSMVERVVMRRTRATIQHHKPSRATMQFCLSVTCLPDELRVSTQCLRSATNEAGKLCQ